MDSNNKHKPSSENSSSTDGAFSANQWQECHPEHRRNNTKYRERERDGEWNRDRPFHGKNRDTKREEEAKMFGDEQGHTQTIQQPSSFPGYNTTDHSYVDNSRRAIPMMCYNGLATIPWSFNPLDSMAINSNPSAMPMSTGMEMVPMPNSAVAPYAYMGMPVNNLYNVFQPRKEIVKLTKSVLYLPNPSEPRPTTRVKPLGCKTVFVGGLPEKATEEIIKEIFDECGSVETIRMSKKNFCHIRFLNEACVENAIYFSGYRIKIENKEEPSFTGRLHVDYGIARDDQYDYECKQRSLQRQARHQEQDYYRSVTRPVVHYSEHEASLLVEKLRNEETFSQASLILITWLERGECSKRNAGTFYSMIQSTNNHVRRLQVDKAKYEEQLNDAKKMLKQNLEGIIRQFTSIVKVYKAVSLQKVWDHFTKAQRKNIEMWRKQTEELRNAHLEEVINEREDEEMELSEDENEDKKSGDTSADEIKGQLEEEILKLREESDSLRSKIETHQNDIMVMQSDQEEKIKQKDLQISSLRQALQNSMKELLSISQKPSQEHEKEGNPECAECNALKCTVQSLQKDVAMQSNLKEEINCKDIQISNLQKALENSKEELAQLNRQLFEENNELYYTFKRTKVREVDLTEDTGDLNLSRKNDPLKCQIEDINDQISKDQHEENVLELHEEIKSLKFQIKNLHNKSKQLEETNIKLWEEYEFLRGQNKILQSEIMVLQYDHTKEINSKDNQILTLTQSLQNSKTQLLNMSKKFYEMDVYSEELYTFKRKKDENDLTNDSSYFYQGATNSNKGTHIKEFQAFKRRRENDIHIHLIHGSKEVYEKNISSVNFEREALLIGVISAFLQLHPFGANIDYICEYLQQSVPSVKAQYVETLLESFPSIFRLQLTGAGASLSKKWHFIGLQAKV